jgi:hypothetical protein
VLCAGWLSACVPEMDQQVWLDVAGQPVQTQPEAKKLAAAMRLCNVIDQNYGVLGQPADLDVSCMAAQGFTLTGTREAQTRAIVPAGT